MGASILLMVVAISVTPAASPTDSPNAELKRYHEYSREMTTALRAETAAKTQVERGNAILALTNLYAQLRTDARLESSETLQNMKNKLWARLTHVRNDLQRILARQSEAERKEKSRSPAGQSRSHAKSAEGRRGARGGRAGIPDFGQALVDLIERTIAPGKWDTTGGPFSIVYFAPRRVLVVSATDEFHHNLNGALKAMRAAGR